jgi:hypothetical protein
MKSYIGLHRCKSVASMKRAPKGLRFIVEWLGRIALRVITAIEDGDCVGLQFDNELLNHVIDGLVAEP